MTLGDVLAKIPGANVRVYDDDCGCLWEVDRDNAFSSIPPRIGFSDHRAIIVYLNPDCPDRSHPDVHLRHCIGFVDGLPDQYIVRYDPLCAELSEAFEP